MVTPRKLKPLRFKDNAIKSSKRFDRFEEIQLILLRIFNQDDAQGTLRLLAKFDPAPSEGFAHPKRDILTCGRLFTPEAIAVLMIVKQENPWQSFPSSF
jgi:hypothetical protein